MNFQFVNKYVYSHPSKGNNMTGYESKRAAAQDKLAQSAQDKLAQSAQEPVACAKVCDDYDVKYDVNPCDTAKSIGLEIRARGTT